MQADSMLADHPMSTGSMLTNAVRELTCLARGTCRAKHGPFKGRIKAEHGSVQSRFRAKHSSFKSGFKTKHGPFKGRIKAEHGSVKGYVKVKLDSFKKLFKAEYGSKKFFRPEPWRQVLFGVTSDGAVRRQGL